MCLCVCTCALVLRHAKHTFSAPFILAYIGLSSCTILPHTISWTPPLSGGGADIEYKMSVLIFSTNLIVVFLILRTIQADIIINVGTAVAQWLKCCATSRKVAGSISPGVTETFHWHSPSDRTLTLGSTEPVTEMSTRNISWGKGGRCLRLTTLPPFWTIVT